MTKTFIPLIIVFLCATHAAWAQPRFSQPHGLYDRQSLTVGITPNDSEAAVCYTTDGSEPTPQSMRYTAPLTLTGTTILRAVEVKGDTVCSPVATASYLFAGSVLHQPDNPEGYPEEWGAYTTIAGTAKADYGMDPEMTLDPTLQPKIIEGLSQLPILSIVTDRNYLFSHDNDAERGGIYIFTGPPVGDDTGHGWTRPASIELFGGPQQHDMTAGCGLRLHGGHGRLAEKNPKHSFRLVFKEQYGQKSLKYPLLGQDAPRKFDQLVLRCHFGNAWQHWGEGNRQKAQYTRDVWARRMQRKMGGTSVDALYVHLFLNGMYWGLYNIAERVDDQFGKDHLGGNKDDIDVVKIEESGGNHIEAGEGTLDAWQLMTALASRADDAGSYRQLADSLLDIPAFIDYMLINQYGGNTDWDHHNWYALRRRGPGSQGFRFLCWDSEIIFENVQENVLGKDNGRQSPTGIFHNLLRNNDFARQYAKRAREVLADDGLLGEASVVAVWDSLYHTIDMALYDEAARWGDYRRDVHRWQSAGQLYTVDDHYQAERRRLLNDYFPYRSGQVLDQILSIVSIDNWEMPDGWELLTAEMFREWDGAGAEAKPLDTQVAVDWNVGQQMGGGSAIAGFVGVDHNRYADLSQYESLVIRGTGSGLRILANRLVPHGPWKQIVVSLNDSDPYWDAAVGGVVLPLADLCNRPTSEGIARQDDFLHLNALKVDWGSSLRVQGLYLIPKADESGIGRLMADDRQTNRYYNLNGQPVSHPRRGLYLKDGKKVLIR